MEALRALDTLSITNLARRTQKAFHDGHFRLWKERMKRLGMPDNKDAVLPDEDMQSVRIDSPDHHYHYPQNGGLPTWLKVAAIIGGGGLAAAGGALINESLKPKPIPPSDGSVLDPGGLQIEVIKP